MLRDDRRASPVRGLLLGLVLALGALLALAEALKAQEAPPAGRRVRVMLVQDSAAAAPQAEAVDQMVRAVLRMREQEERVAQELARTPDELRRRALEQQLTSLIRTSAGLLTRLELQCTAEQEMPAGYLGVSFTGEFTVTRDRGAASVFRFAQWPLIESVEPGSPAAEAGVEPGDRLVAVDRLDVTNQPVVFAQLLKPGRRVALRVQRDGELRDLSAVVQARPGSYGRPCQALDIMLASRTPLPFRGPGAASEPSGTVTLRRARPPRAASPTVVAGSTVPAPPPPPDPPTAPMPFVWVGSGSFVAGAQLRALDADLRDFTGVERGVFVVNVAQGTPARESGLRAGDVITAADDTPVSTVAALQRHVGSATGRNVALTVVRKGKTQPLTLSW